MTAVAISGWAAFLAGLLSFLSPCVLPLLPVYLTYLAGASIADAGAGRRLTVRLVVNALLFILGFSLIFILLGLSASAVGALLIAHQELLQRLSGAAAVLFGLYLAGFLPLPFLERGGGVKPAVTGTPGASFLLGLAVSLGWTPCVGPILGSILLLAANQADLVRGAYLLALYAAGLAVPFLLAAFFLGAVTSRLRNWGRFAAAARVAAGIVLVIAGLLVAGGLLPRISAWFSF